LLNEKDIFPSTGFPCNQIVVDLSTGYRVMVIRDSNKKYPRELSEETEKVEYKDQFKTLNPNIDPLIN
jgi:hypothetical protein